MCFLFSTPNRISLLAREIATIRQEPAQSVDVYASRVTELCHRFIAEAVRTAPADLSPYEHAWEIFVTATLENRLLPAIRIESIREDPVLTFQEARIRAKKHEANTPQDLSHPPPRMRRLSLTPPS